MCKVIFYSLQGYGVNLKLTIKIKKLNSGNRRKLTMKVRKNYKAKH